MYIIVSLVFLISFFTGLVITMSDDDKDIIKDDNKTNIVVSKQPYAIIDNEIIDKWYPNDDWHTMYVCEIEKMLVR